MRNYKKEFVEYVKKRNKLIWHLYFTEKMTGDEICEVLKGSVEFEPISREQVYAIIREKKK